MTPWRVLVCWQPTVAVKKVELCAILGRDFTEDEFQTLCFEFGIELDDVLVEVEEGSTGPGEVVWKVEVAANRYDLLCVEGIGRALRTFLGLEVMPVRNLASCFFCVFDTVLFVQCLSPALQRVMRRRRPLPQQSMARIDVPGFLPRTPHPASRAAQVAMLKHHVYRVKHDHRCYLALFPTGVQDCRAGVTLGDERGSSDRGVCACLLACLLRAVTWLRLLLGFGRGKCVCPSDVCQAWCTRPLSPLQLIRPYVVCAVLRGMEFTPQRYKR